MIKIKKTKSVEMSFNEETKAVWLTLDSHETTEIPMKVIFQVKRGLETAVQKFYRRKVK